MAVAAVRLEAPQRPLPGGDIGDECIDVGRPGPPPVRAAPTLPPSAWASCTSISRHSARWINWRWRCAPLPPRVGRPMLQRWPSCAPGCGPSPSCCAAAVAGRALGSGRARLPHWPTGRGNHKGAAAGGLAPLDPAWSVAKASGRSGRAQPIARAPANRKPIAIGARPRPRPRPAMRQSQPIKCSPAPCKHPHRRLVPWGNGSRFPFCNFD